MKRVLHVFVTRKSDLCCEEMSNTPQGIELLSVVHFSSLNRHIAVARCTVVPVEGSSPRGYCESMTSDPKATVVRDTKAIDLGPASNSHAGHKMSDMHGSHDRHAGHSVAMFRDKFWLSFALTIPVVIWSSDVQRWFGYTAPSFPGSRLIPAVLGTLVFVYGGLVFIRGARRELADHKPGMMTLISLAIIVAFGTSLAAAFGLFEIDVWWELASLITIMVLGHWLEMRAISQARGALNALAALLPDTAERVTGAETQTVPISELKVDDVVLVRPGTRVPADGEVVEGSADVDESMITGESRSVSKAPGGKVIAGTVAAGGSLRVRITAVGEQTARSEE